MGGVQDPCEKMEIRWGDVAMSAAYRMLIWAEVSRKSNCQDESYHLPSFFVPTNLPNSFTLSLFSHYHHSLPCSILPSQTPFLYILVNNSHHHAKTATKMLQAHPYNLIQSIKALNKLLLYVLSPHYFKTCLCLYVCMGAHLFILA